MKTPDTTLEQWQVLQAIVECGGYAQAAEALGRSQSSVSYMMARLQEQVGVDLLVIEGRKAVLTANGRVLLAQAAELLAGAQNLEQLAASLGQGWEAEVRLAVDAAFPTPALLQALCAFTSQVSQTRVQLKEVVLSGADEALLSQSVDMAIGSRVPVGHLGNLLADVEFIAVAHPDHALHRLGRKLDADDLKNELHVVLSDSGTLNPRDDGWLGARQRWTVTSMATSKAMIEEGLGYAWLPRHLIRKELERGTLWPLPLNQGGSRRVPLYLIFARGTHAGPATRQLAEMLEQAARAALGPALSP